MLEISATPYLYTLRFYDWLRRDLEGDLRPVHLERAFDNLVHRLDLGVGRYRLRRVRGEPCKAIKAFVR